MRALARKFGARFTAEAGEVTGLIAMTSEPALAEPRQHAPAAALAAAL